MGSDPLLDSGDGVPYVSLTLRVFSLIACVLVHHINFFQFIKRVGADEYRGQFLDFILYII